MKFRHFTFTAVTACLVAFGSASAEVTYNSGKPQKLATSAHTFTTLDRNGDHRISRSEAGFDRVMSETFAEIDTDGDGFVSTAEYSTAEKNRNTVSSNSPAQ